MMRRPRLRGPFAVLFGGWGLAEHFFEKMEVFEGDGNGPGGIGRAKGSDGGRGGYGLSGFVSQLAILEEIELSCGAIVGSGEGGFVADEEVQGAAAVGEVAEGEGYTVLVFDSFELPGKTDAGLLHFVFEHAGFDRADAAEAPAGDGEGLNELGFDGVGGVIAVEVGVEEGLEVLFGFGGEGREVGGESVAEGVLGGFGFAFGGFGAVRFGSVEAGGFGFKK